MAEPGRILIIDDELAIRRIVRVTLESNGFTVFEASNGKEGIYQAATEKPGVILLDLGLPDMDGIKVLAKIREWSAVPIIILSVRNEEESKVAALEAGADDYISKPFGVKELLARIKVAVRHSIKPEEELSEFRNRNLFVDIVRHIVKIGESEIKLTATEYSLLLLLLKNQDRLLTHSHIIKELWGPYAAGGTQRLRVHMAQLRKKSRQAIKRKN